jgi:hypothetical protein
VTFDPIRYGPAVAAILGDGSRLADLGPGKPNEAMRPKIAAITELPPDHLAGLWLYHDFLDESHTISQEIHSPTGSFWHAIMHRREPDPSNSKYWWARVGAHPVLNELKETAPALGYNYTNPQHFVDFCEQVRGTNSLEETLAKRVQLLEWQLLFHYCFQMSIR